MYYKHILVFCLIGLFSVPIDSVGQRKLKRTHRNFTVNYLAKPELMLHGTQTIAVLDFNEEAVPDSVNITGPGSKFAEMITAALLEDEYGMNEKREGLGVLADIFSTKNGKTFLQGSTTRIYTLVAREELSDVLEGLKMSSDPFSDPSTAAEIGRIVNAQAIITGAIYINSADKNTRQPRVRKVDGKNRTIQVPCRRRDVQVRVSWKIINQETAELIDAQMAQQAEKSEVCSDTQSLADITGRGLDSRESMVDRAMNTLSIQVAGYIMPKYSSQKLRLRRFDEDKKYWREGQEAIELGRDMEVDKAYAGFMALYEKHKYDRVLLENLGIINEAVGNYEAAKKFYKTAMSISDEPHFEEYIERVEDQIAFMDELASMGIVISEYAFEEMSQAELLRIKLVKECEVFVDAAVTSEVVDTLPAEMRLTVLDTRSEWYHVQSPGGKDAMGYLKQECSVTI